MRYTFCTESAYLWSARHIQIKRQLQRTIIKGKGQRVMEPWKETSSHIQGFTIHLILTSLINNVVLGVPTSQKAQLQILTLRKKLGIWRLLNSYNLKSYYTYSKHQKRIMLFKVSIFCRLPHCQKTSLATTGATSQTLLLTL